MWARAEEATGVSGIADEYYGYYNDAADFGACSYHSRSAAPPAAKGGRAPLSSAPLHPRAVVVAGTAADQYTLPNVVAGSPIQRAAWWGHAAQSAPLMPVGRPWAQAP